MKMLYLILSIAGIIAPNVLVVVESFETGNILLYADLPSTMKGMFANRISTIFMIDLLAAVFVYMIWTAQEAKKHKIQRVWIFWILTMALGLAGTFPLFLYWRERAKEL